MSEKIKSSDIFEGEIFKVLIDGAEEAKKQIALLNTELVKVGTSFKNELGSSKTESIKDIDALLTKSKQLNAEVEKQVKLNTAQSELNRNYRLEEIRLQKAREKAVDDFNRKEQKDQERANKELEKRLKKEKDLADAYKQLTINTRDLKNESKRLGAEMLELEKQGKKNSSEYYKLSRQYKETTKSAIEGDKALKKLDSTVGDNFRNVGNYEKAVGKLKYALTQLGLAFGVFDGIRALIDTQVKLDSLNLALKNVSGSTKEYQANFAFLRTIANKYGQDLIGLIDSYKNFISASESSNLSLSQRRRIYESIVKAGSAMALSNDNVKGSLLAISQMFSKGTVSAEELRQQLAERLPGAFKMMADSMGVSEAELNKLMKDGKVLADEVLPRFAIVLERSMGKNAEERLKTLGGAWNVLKNNITLYFDQAQKNININKTLAFIIKTLGENIGSVLTTFKNLTLAFVTYKATVIGAELATRLLNGTLLKTAEDAKTGESSITKFGKAFTTAGWTIAISLVMKLAEYFIDLAKGTDLATEAYLRYKNATDVGNTNADKFIDKQRYLLAIEKERLDKLKKAGQITDEQHKKLMKQKDEEIKANIKAEIQRLRGERGTVVGSMLQIEKKYADGKVVSPYNNSDLMTAQADIQNKSRFATSQKEIDALLSKYEKIKSSLEEVERYSKLKAKRIRIDTEMPNYLDELRDMETMSTKFKASSETISKGVLEHTKEIRDLNVEYNKTNIYLSRQVEILKDINEINAKNKLQESIDKTANILQQEEKNVNMTGQYNAGAVQVAIELEYQAKKDYEIKAFKKIEEDKKIRDKKTFNDELDNVKEQEKTKMNELMEINSDYYRRLADYRKNINEPNLSTAKQKELQKEKEWLLGEEKDIKVKTKQIKDGANKEEVQVYQNKIKREEDTYLEIEGLTIEHEGKLANIKRDSQTKTDEELAKLELIRAEKRLEIIKNTAESVNNLIQKSLDHYINLAERRIDLLDKRMERMSTQADFLRDKAVAGNIQAQESLAEIDKQQIEGEKQKLKEQKSIQKLQIAMTVLQAYSNNIQNAKLGQNPFTKTFTDITLLGQLINTVSNNMPAYFDGTEDTGTNGKGVDGKGGFHAILHPNERVIPKALNSKIGDLSNLEIAKLAEDFHRGEVMRKGEGAMQLNVNSWGADMIVSKLESLEQTIKNKPENQVEVAEILNGVMHIVETKKSGNTKVRNISRFS